MKDRMILVLVSAVLFGALGFVMGHFWPPSEAEHSSSPATSAPLDSPAERSPTKPAAQPRLAAPVPCDCKQARKEEPAGKIEHLEAKVAFQKAMLEGYREQFMGKPIPWPEQTLPQYKEENFQANLDRAILESGAAVDLVAFDCKEPPCIATMRVLPGESRNLLLSEAWVKNYGDNISSNHTGWIDCGNGQKERVWFLSPAGDGLIDPGKMSRDEFRESLRKLSQASPDKNNFKRLKARWEEIREGWNCLP